MYLMISASRALTGPARRRIDARSVQDLIDGRWRDGDAEIGQLAVDPPVAPQRVLPGKANGYPGNIPGCRRAAGSAPVIDTLEADRYGQEVLAAWIGKENSATP